ncbi:MAG: MATE family efflux transporter [Lachnospiraceae bacterium]|nr:MATE family efflux transporter [Lachnospiraceae bacterium]
MVKQYIGSKQFYKYVFTIMAPVLLQNVITNFVSLLDNIMVGQVGTEAMSGVAIANQLIFVFNLCIFGGLAGAGIYTAQFYGKGDNKGITNSIRMKLYIAVAASVIFALIFWTGGSGLINAFLHEGNEALDLKETFTHSFNYLHIMMIQLLPFSLSQVYSSSLRETKDTVFPMKASIIAVAVNLVGNYILIFGKLGLPALGAEGAAIATVIARFAECIILIAYTHSKKEKFPFFEGLLKTLKIPKGLVREIAIKGAPLLVNEVLWSAGMAMQNQCYSVRGLEVVSATNISSTISNLFFSAMMATGSAIAIIIGQKLGAGKKEEAVKEDKQIIALTIVMCIVLGIILALIAPLISGIYNTTPAVKELANDFLLITACFLPLYGYTNCCYFTLRTGGKTIITFIFDSFLIWVAYVPLAFVLTRFTDINIVTVYILVNCLEVIKCLIGFFMLKSKKWVVNLVSDDKIA